MTKSNAQAQAFWDGMYGEETFAYGEAPDEYLVSQRHRFRPGMRALVPGDGEGRNGVWLAEQGLTVTAVDLSAVGQSKARHLAERRGVPLTAIQADLVTWEWPVSRFDVVASVFLHLPSDVRRRVHLAMLNSLRPGGLLLIKGFRPEQLRYRERLGSTGGPPKEEMLFTPEMLRADFAEAEELELEVADVEMGSGSKHSGLSAVVRAVFKRTDTY